MTKKLINKTQVRKILWERGFRINAGATKNLAEILAKKNRAFLERVMRSARTSGRKTIKEEDFKGIAVEASL